MTARRLMTSGRRGEAGRTRGTPRVLVGAAISLMLAAGAWADDLGREISGVLTRAKLGTARVGISIVDVQSGATLAEMRSGEGFIPASNMKLLTSGAALRTLGADYEFHTRLVQVGNALVVEGSGDPAFGDPELLKDMGMGSGEFITKLVEAVSNTVGAGVGGEVAPSFREVIVDDRVFDRQAVHPTWPADQLNRWYCAQVSGLTFHANVLWLYAWPAAKEGEQPRLKTEPSAPWLEITNRARTVRTQTTTLWADRERGTNRFNVHGALRGALEEPIEVCLDQPAGVFGRLLAEKLGAAGLGKPVWRMAGLDEQIGTERKVLAVVQTPISQVLERCNGDSHNLYAEALIKLIGHQITQQPGSWTNGAAVIRMQLRDKVGPSAAAAVNIADGSGMSRDNKVTPGVLSAWLASMSQDAAVADSFIESIPVAGEEGSVKKRFRNSKLANEVRAKSGYINGVRCLSGYVTDTASGRQIAFSILVNEIPANVSGQRVKEFHEDVVELIDKRLSEKVRAAGEREAVGG
ncbi:MAG: D-alanyl-D-alanine carboxypeptidase/D-alanyl-D-alanine-endopeptidase [Phycisphaerales bacterium]|nr:D-alanyl-D-alanine carboxypeptidase/D-alanyl-D-alanine-endopeptidase [Phycisphaerales bacterium]